MVEYGMAIFKKPKEEFYDLNGMFSKSSMYTILPIAILYKTHVCKISLEGVIWLPMGRTG